MISTIEYAVLKKYFHVNTTLDEAPPRLSLKAMFGNDFPDYVKDKLIIDFGCGHGDDSIAMAKWGARFVLGLDIRQEIIDKNKKSTILPNCEFATSLPEIFYTQADIVISIDAFEHFAQPEKVLDQMYECLKPGGKAFICFGPTWYHPLGGHTFSVFPWSHLLLSESALIKWRNQFYSDGATKFTEVAGGLNKLSISNFERIFDESRFVVESIECRPIRGKEWLQKLAGKEFTTSMVLAQLKKPFKFDKGLLSLI